MLKDGQIRSLSGRVQFYIQQQSSTKNDLDTTQDNAYKAMRQASKARAQLIAERQDYLLQAGQLDRIIRAGSTRYQELRRSNEAQQAVINKLNASGTASRLEYENAESRSHHLEQIGIKYEDRLQDHRAN